MSTASIGMTKSVFCFDTNTVSQEFLLACNSVLSKMALLFIFCVSQGAAVLEGDFVIFGTPMPAALCWMLVIWNIFYPLLIAVMFINKVAEDVTLLCKSGPVFTLARMACCLSI